MNNVEIISGINKVVEGLELIKNALITEGVVVKATPIAPKEEKAQTEANTVETDGNAEVVGKYSVEELNAMKYNEFKKYASSLGVKCTGTRDEIMERILALDGAVEDTDANESVEEDVAEDVEDTNVAEEEVPTKSDKPTTSKKFSKAKADEPAKDEFDGQAEEIAKDTPVEDIIEALSDVGLEANKKNAVSLLAKALREGLIELEEDEEEGVDNADVDVDEEDGEEISATSYFEQFDPKGYNNPENMTEERAEAIESKIDEVLTLYSDGKLTDDDIASYVEDNATESEIDLLGDEYTEEDILKLYIELIKRTIDNDGEEHEPGDPYEVADFDLCCGRELKYSKKTKKYICEHCGTEYEAE